VVDLNLLTLIKNEKELRAFQRLFGQKRDIRNTIINTVEDLSNLVAKDAFYDDIVKLSENQIKNGKRAIVYNTRLDALKQFPNQKVIALFSYGKRSSRNFR
jgi:hypothetical protein